MDVISDLDFSNFTKNYVVLLNGSSTGDDSANDDVPAQSRRRLAVSYQIIITCFYIFGIGGNFAALAIITRNKTKRYKKQTLMLKSLALNDLTALLGSFVLMYVDLYMPSADARWLCATRVIWRTFGLGSGCVALVMALERWLALSHPFTYQKNVTQAVVRLSILGLWAFNVLVVCAPFFGFGLWFDESRSQRPCVRYRFGKATIDKAYAYFVFTFGMNMCICIVCCNLSVMRVLCRMGKRMITRRYSRASCRSSSSANEPTYNIATPEEVSFARLMAVLSIFFVMCWAPQLLAIIAAQHSLIERNSPLYKAADILIALNFTLDPYIYVLFRRQQMCTWKSLRKTTIVLESSHRKSSTLPNSAIHDSFRSHTIDEESSSGIITQPMTTSTRVPSHKREYLPLRVPL